MYIKNKNMLFDDIKIENSFFKDLSDVIAIKSIKYESEHNAPFGKNILECLQHYIKIAKKLNLNIINYDNYCAEICIGKGQEIGIACHIDVVQITGKCQYQLTYDDLYIYGRGVVDDKTSTLLIMYILYELINKNYKFNKKIRFFIGCDEENNWQDIQYLKSKTKLPKFGFSPDGFFPVVYAEKGIYNIKFKIPKLKNFYNLTGGSAFNIVPSYVSVRQKQNIDINIIKEHMLNIDNNLIWYNGISCHSSTPQYGDNAIKHILEYCNNNGEDLNNVLSCIFYDKFNINNIVTDQGNVTMSANIIKEYENYIEISCDVRIPAPLTINDIKNIIDKFKIQYEIIELHKPYIINKNSNFVKTLLNSYINVTQKFDALPISLSGGTYARIFDVGCAFGPIHNNKEEDVAHTENEKMSIKNLKNIYNIYKQTIINIISTKNDYDI